MKNARLEGILTDTESVTWAYQNHTINCNIIFMKNRRLEGILTDTENVTWAYQNHNIICNKIFRTTYSLWLSNKHLQHYLVDVPWIITRDGRMKTKYFPVSGNQNIITDSLSVKLESDPRLGLLRHSRGSAIIKDSLNGLSIFI